MIDVLVAVSLVAGDVEQEVQGPAEQQSQDNVDQHLDLGHGPVGLGFGASDGHEDFVVFDASSILYLRVG